MNPVFWLLVILALVALWFLLSCCFKPIGDFFMSIFRKTKEDIDDNEDYE